MIVGTQTLTTVGATIIWAEALVEMMVEILVVEWVVAEAEPLATVAMHSDGMYLIFSLKHFKM